ncbi:hypothetical protein [Bradyrhizobium elkanii]|uniref:hypothetical protein n=1 Tax=Bradyrhizobium elkanii TaxID=29448 RepID=UPI003D2591F2
MLQLPQSSPTKGRFSRADLAAITRGAKAKVRRPKPEPIIALLRQADTALQQYIEAHNALFELDGKLPEEVRGWHHMKPPAELEREFGWNFLFSNEDHIKKSFRVRRRLAREKIRHHRGVLKKRSDIDQLQREAAASLAAAEHTLGLLSRLEKPFLAAFIKHKRQLLSLQKKSGLLDARERSRRCRRRLAELTKKIGNSRPKTSAGAIAVAQYVESRLWCDLPGMFNDDTGDFPGSLGQLLRHALTILSKNVNSDVSTPHH